MVGVVASSPHNATRPANAARAGKKKARDLHQVAGLFRL